MIYNMLFQFFLFIFSSSFNNLIFRYGKCYLTFMGAKICICFEMRDSLWRFDHITSPINRTNPSIIPSTLTCSKAAMYSCRRSTGITTQG